MSENLRTNHALKLLSALERMKLDKFICDFIIKVGAKEFPVHRAVLAGCSKYFEGLFESGMKEVQAGTIDLKEVTEKAVGVCIEFMYSANAQLEMEHIQDVLKASNLLQLDDLYKLCFNLIEKNISPQNCLDVRIIAENYENAGLLEKSEKIAILNFEDVLKCETFLTLRRGDVLRYISQVRYNVSWQAVVTWSKEHGNDFIKICEDVVFEEYPFEFLLKNILADPLVQKKEPIKRRVIKAIFADVPKLRKNLDAKNCLNLRKLAISNNVEGDADVVMLTFMRANFEKLLIQQRFTEITWSDFLSIFKSPDTKISDDLKWEAVMKWIKADKKKRKKYFQELFFLLRLENFTIEFLQDTMQNESLVTESSKCCSLLMKAALSKASQLSKENERLQRSVSTQGLDEGKPEIVCGMTGRMQATTSSWRCLDGYEGWPTISIHYTFEAGKAKGVSFEKVEYTAYLPAVRNLGSMVRQANSAGHVFKLERISGPNKGRIVWGDIPLKTKWSGGPEMNGYPDPEYEDKLLKALASCGITE